MCPLLYTNTTFIINKSKHDIKTMCTVLGVARRTYYKSFDKTKSARELENEELKSAIKRIYKR